MSLPLLDGEGFGGRIFGMSCALELFVVLEGLWKVSKTLGECVLQS